MQKPKSEGGRSTLPMTPRQMLAIIFWLAEIQRQGEKVVKE